MHHSLNTARQTLHIGKARLYKFLEELEIEPTLEGNTKLISDDQLDLIREAIQGSVGDSPEYRIHKRKTVSGNNRDSLSTEIEDRQDKTSQTGSTYEALRSQIDYLQKALESEQAERREKDKRHDEVIRELNQSTERFQAMLMQLQNKNAELNQKLLAAPVERQDFSTMKEKFEGEEVSIVSNQNPEPVPEQPVLSQRSWITPIIWAFAAALLTISAVEFGGLSVGNLVRDLLVTR